MQESRGRHLLVWIGSTFLPISGVEAKRSLFARLLEHENDADIDEPLSIVAPDPKARGAPLGVKPGVVYEDDDMDDVVKNLKKRAAQEKKEIMKKIGPPSKPVAEMTKEEQLEHLEKLKEARKLQKATAEKLAKKEREAQRRQAVKDAGEARRKREELALKRAAEAKVQNRSMSSAEAEFSSRSPPSETGEEGSS
jgi:type IV secretory pathway VirB10-like protein